MIQFKNLSFNYLHGKFAVQNLNFSINEGECFVLIGPSGSGKTTTLKLLNRLINPTEGEILFNGANINGMNEYELRRDLGYVFQQIALFPHLTVEENIAIVPQLKKWGKERINNRVSELLQLVELDPDEYKQKSIYNLSGGQQQRVGVARALAGEPSVLLMDEPFSALDPVTREQLQKDLMCLKEKINQTILFVTHDLEEAFFLGDRIGIMDSGKLVQIGTKEEIINFPKNQFVENFLSSYLEKKVVEGGMLR